MTAISSGPWATVLVLQRAASLPAVGPRVFGYDEALEVVLDGIMTGDVPSRQAIKNLCANRAGKDRHRRRLARRHTDGERLECPADAIDARRLMMFVRTVLTEAEFNVLAELVDSSYEEVAMASGVPVGTIKARAARARARARAAYASRFDGYRTGEAAA